MSCPSAVIFLELDLDDRHRYTQILLLRPKIGLSCSISVSQLCSLALEIFDIYRASASGRFRRIFFWGSQLVINLPRLDRFSLSAFSLFPICLSTLTLVYNFWCVTAGHWADQSVCLIFTPSMDTSFSTNDSRVQTAADF